MGMKEKFGDFKDKLFFSFFFLCVEFQTDFF
jgi:hypothetical protein